MSRNMFEKDEHYQFLLKYFPENVILERFIVVWQEVRYVLRKTEHEKNFSIDTESFRMFILDYFTDIARIKDFHDIDFANTNKIYSYTLYWFVRRHPIQILNPTVRHFDINERVGLAITLPKILTSLGVNPKKFDGVTAEQTSEFTMLFLYNLRYRQNTAQSLELMVDALRCGLTYGECCQHIKQPTP